MKMQKSIIPEPSERGIQGLGYCFDSQGQSVRLLLLGVRAARCAHPCATRANSHPAFCHPDTAGLLLPSHAQHRPKRSPKWSIDKKKKLANENRLFSCSMELPFQLFFSFFPVRHRSIQKSVKWVIVVWAQEMAEFMHKYVINTIQGHATQLQIEADDAFRTA